MCVTKSRTSSFLISWFNLFLEIAAIILGVHFCGMEKSLFFESAVAEDGTDEPDNASDTSDGVL